MTPDDIRSILGPSADPDLVAGVLRIGPTPAELTEARAWVETDEAQVNEHRPFPTGRVARLVELLESDRPDGDEVW